jgi:putative transcriptional regulator
MTEIGDRILSGLGDVLAFSEGKAGKRRIHQVKVPRRVNVKAIRTRLRMTQAEFASTFGFTLHAVRNWEQGAHTRRGSTRAADGDRARAGSGCSCIAQGGLTRVIVDFR